MVLSRWADYYGRMVDRSLKRITVWEILVVIVAVLIIVAWAIPAGLWVYVAGAQLLLPWIVTGLGIVGLIGLAATRLNRLWPAVLVATPVVCTLIAPLWDLPRLSTKPCGTAEVNVLAVNSKQSFAAPEDVAWAMAETDADLLSVSEVNPDFEQRIRELLPNHPHHIGESDVKGFGGTHLFSRWPLEDNGSRSKEVSVFAQPRATVQTPTGDISVAAVHVPPPITTEHYWVTEMTDTAQWSANAGDDTVIALGDFNSTPGHLEFQQLMKTGFDDRDKHLPWRLTWGPMVGGPSIAKLDHVFVRNGHIMTQQIMNLEKSDHAMVAATVCTTAAAQPTS